MVLEAAATAAMPSFDLPVINTNTGAVEVRKLNDVADMVGITLKLRYSL